MTSQDDTIAAISTPPGEGGVGIVRLSGPESLSIAAKLFRHPSRTDLHATAQRVLYGHIVDRDSQPLDEVLLHIMRAPKSYTREDVVEINCHGGAGPVNAVLEEALVCGARLAKPGEFTLRAFLNGRIDLVQAEAVIDVIRARTHESLQAANAASSGVLSKSIQRIRDTLVQALARIEAAVDFPEDDLEELLDTKLFEQVSQAHHEMTALLETSDAGRLYREGASVAITGRPNVGKSSLFNALLRDARAIVTAQPGTTRDRLDEYITIAGVPVKLCDTAGLHTTDDEVEQIGVAVARTALQEAQLVLFVVEAGTPLSDEDRAIAQELDALAVPVVIVLNKIDLAPDATIPSISLVHQGACPVSTLNGDGLEAVEELLGTLLLGGLNLAADQAMITRMHQKESLWTAVACLDRFLENPGLSPEFLALEVGQALHALGEITGETTPDEVLEAIFASFCIGK